MHLPKDDAALTPPMGWNSWDCFAAGVTEEQLLANAAGLARLKAFGWEYVVCDIQWSEPLPPVRETRALYTGSSRRSLWMPGEGRSRQSIDSPHQKAEEAFGRLPTGSTPWG